MKSTYTILQSISISLLLVTSSTLLTASNTILSEDIDCTKKEETCYGSRTWKDGRTYKGEFSFGKPQGIGTMTWPNGSTYEGEFLNGFRHGQGLQTNDDGSIYKGAFVDGYMHGQGAYDFPCGHQYVGSFLKDKMHGDGSIQFIDGTSYTGQWKNGKPNGQGQFLRNDKSTFTGNFKSGIRDGAGSVTFDENKFEGTWKKNQLGGSSVFKFANGDQLHCNWKNGLLMREVCHYTFADGQTKKASLDRLTSDRSIADNMTWVLYIDAVEKVTNKDKKSAKAKLIVAKNITTKNSRLYKMVKAQLDKIAK